MFDADDVRLFAKAAIEYDRHGILPVDTEVELQSTACCAACAVELIETALREAM